MKPWHKRLYAILIAANVIAYASYAYVYGNPFDFSWFPDFSWVQWLGR